MGSNSSNRQESAVDWSLWQTRQTADGLVVKVKGMPGSKRAGLRGIQNGSMRVGVTQVAEKGRANEAILQVLAQALGIKMQRLEIVAGETSRDKQVLIHQLDRAGLLALQKQPPQS